MPLLRGATQRLVLAAQSEGLPVPPSSRSSGSSSSSARATSTRSAALSTASTTIKPPPPAPKLVSVPVAPPPVIHTSAYFQQTQGWARAQQELPTLPGSNEGAQQKPADINSNALVWALEKVDAQLNAVEQQPHDVHVALYQFSNGPVGQATSRSVQAAARLTMTATIEAAKVAAPVGKWALQQGFKAAVGLVGRALEQEQKQEQQQKQLRQQQLKQGTTKKKAVGKR